MSNTHIGMVEQFSHEVQAVAGDEAQAIVAVGIESLGPKTSTEALAIWMNGAVERMDAALSPAEREQIMSNCGRNCAHVNGQVIERARAYRAKFASEEAYIDAQLKKRPTTSHIERDGDSLVQVYTPQEMKRPMRCFCGLMHDLPAGVEASPTYCLCSRAFVQTFWEAVLGRPVKVTVLQSALTGASECRFKIDIS